MHSHNMQVLHLLGDSAGNSRELRIEIADRLCWTWSDKGAEKEGKIYIAYLEHFG